MILHFVESTYFQISLDPLIHTHTHSDKSYTTTNRQIFVAQILILDKNLAQTHDGGDTHTRKFGNFKCLCVCMREIRDNLCVCVYLADQTCKLQLRVKGVLSMCLHSASLTHTHRQRQTAKGREVEEHPHTQTDRHALGSCRRRIVTI